MAHDDDDLLAWIAELRGRLKRHELVGLDPIDIGDGTGELHAARTIRIMLNDLDDLDAFHRRPLRNGHPPSENELGYMRDRLHDLLADFRRLRELLS